MQISLQPAWHAAYTKWRNHKVCTLLDENPNMLRYEALRLANRLADKRFAKYLRFPHTKKPKRPKRARKRRSEKRRMVPVQTPHLDGVAPTTELIARAPKGTERASMCPVTRSRRLYSVTATDGH